MISFSLGRRDDQQFQETGQLHLLLGVEIRLVTIGHLAVNNSGVHDVIFCFGFWNGISMYH
jgi:hypothetical protein